MTDENPFADLAQPDVSTRAEPDIPESVAIEQPNPFADLSQPDLPEKTTALGAAGAHALAAALPAAASLPAAGAGVALGATLGAAAGPAAPIAVPTLGLAGGLAGGILGAGAVAKAQEWALSQLPESWRDPLEQQLATSEIEHPTASFIGGLVPFALTMKPGPLAKKALPESATATERLLADPVTARLFGGGLMGGLELAQEKAEGRPADWTNIAISTGFGVMFNQPRALGQRLINLGEHGVGGLVSRARSDNPTLAELHDLGVMGPGVTEETATSALEMAEEAKADAQNTRAAELEPPALDPHALARQYEPELFGRYDALLEHRNTLRAQIAEMSHPGEEAIAGAEAQVAEANKALEDHIAATGGYTGGREARRLRANARTAQAAYDALIERGRAFEEGRGLETEEMAQARAQLQSVDYEMRDLGREVAAAYRRAAEHGGETVETPVEEAPEPVKSEAEAPPEVAGPTLEEQRQTIADDVKRQLVAAGRPEEEARAAGRLVAVRYVTRANLFKGALGTAEELYRREGAEIRGVGRAAPPTPGEPPIAPEQPVAEEPIFIGGKKVEGEFAAKLRDRIVEREAPELAAAVAGEAEPLFIGGQEIKGPLAEKLRARLAAEPAPPEPEAPAAPLMPTVEKPEIAAPAPAEGGGIEALDPATIGVDAERFQFKAGGDVEGVTERLQGIEKWDARLAGTALVWRDAEGKNWIADGHQRLGLAKRLSEQGQGDIRLNAFVLDAKDGISDSDARVIAAVKNIAEGSGTSIDAAKIMKEAEGKNIDLPPLPPRSALVREGQALARLSPEAFGMAINEVVPTGQAAIVGKLVVDPMQQVEAMRVLSKAQPDNLRQAEMIVREILATGTEEMTRQGGLFGEEAFASSVVLERARIADEALKIIKRDRSTFKTLVSEAEGIQALGRNVLDIETNKERLTADEQASQFLSQLATRKGPISDELTEIAKRLKAGDIGRAEAGREFVGTIRRAIESGLAERTDVGGAVAGAAGERELTQEQKFEPGAEGKPQQLIPGVEPVTDRARAELAAGKPMQGGAAELPEGGLFDEAAHNQKELFQNEYKVKPPKKLYRGIVEGQQESGAAGLGTAHLGRGLYTTRSRDFAKMYATSGKIEEISPERAWPRSPLILRGSGGAESLLLDYVFKTTEFKNAREFNAAFPDRAEFLKSRGFDGVIAGDEVVRFPDNAGEFLQFAKGKITLREGQRPIIRLMRDADASTFIHETGHDWLEQMLRDSIHEAAPAQLKDDATTILDWLKVKSAEDVTTRQHEKFARGFEQYLREGVAPSKELAGVFAKFKQWLITIYQTIKGLGAPINDDIRGVFDRMLTEEPQRTVIAPEREPLSALAKEHELDAQLIEPQDAGAAADRIEAETARQIEEMPEDVRAIATEPAEPSEQAVAAPAGGEGGSGGGEVTTGVAGAAAAAGEDVARPLPVSPGAGETPPEAGRVRVPLDGLMPRSRESIIGQPNRISSLENLVTELGGGIDAETRQYLDDILAKTKDFSVERRGHITHGQIADWYEASGLRPEEIPEHQIGQAFNAEQMYENYRAIKTLNERIYEHGQNGDVVSYERDRALRETLIKGFVGARAEAGRSLSIFNRILKEMRAEATGGEETKELFQLWRQITGRDYEASKNDAYAVSKLQNPAAVGQFLRNTEERTYGRMAHEYWLSAIVSNYISQMTDTVGNFVTLANRLTLETPVAAALGAAGEGERVRLGEMAAGWKSLPGAVAPAVRAAVETLRTGERIELPGGVAQGALDIGGARGIPFKEEATWTDAKASTFGLLTGISDAVRAMGAITPDAPLFKTVATERGQIPNIELKGAPIPLGDFLRSPLNFLSSMEAFSASLAFTVEKNTIAYRRAANEGHAGDMLDQRMAELMKAPPIDMMEEATREARHGSLAYKGGPLSGALAQLVNKAEIAGIPFGRFLVPFVNISSIMMNEALLKRTPLGFLSTEVRADLLGSNGPIAQQKAQARMMVGTSIALATMGLAAMGKITGSGPDEPKERAVWQAAGIQPYSVKIGDSWYSYKRLGVFGLHLGVAADMVQVAQKASEKDYSDAVGTFVHAIAKNVIDQSYFKGPSDFLRAVTEKGYGERYVQNFLSGFVPFSSGLGQTAQLVDPYSREARTVVDAIRAKIPGLSSDLLPRLDMWGRPIPARDPLGPFAIWTRQQATDPVAHEMRRLEYFPSVTQRKIRGVKLTGAQYHDYARMSGMMAKENLDRIVNSTRWGSIDDERKKDVIKKAIEASREVAVGKMFQRYPSILVQARDLKRAPFERK